MWSLLLNFTKIWPMSSKGQAAKKQQQYNPVHVKMPVKSRARVDHRACPYQHKPTDVLMKLAQQRGIAIDLPPNHRCLVTRLRTKDQQECKYLVYTIKEMQTFVKDRGLVMKRKHPYKQDIIDVLVKADKEWTFPFLDLPPELREMTYEYAVAVDGTLKNPSQPPITRVSKVTRAESLPVFYRINHFSICICMCPICRHIEGNSTRQICYESAQYLRSLTNQNIALIKNLEIELRDPFDIGSNLAKLFLRISFHNVNTAHSGPVVWTKLTFVDLNRFFRSALEKRELQRETLHCAIVSAFGRVALGDSRNLSFERLQAFAARVPWDITELQVKCHTVGCKAHAK